MRKIIPILLAGLWMVACKKQGVDNSATHILGFFTDSKIKINQITLIYDSTALRDSIDLAHPPTNRIYEWKVSPATGTPVWGDRYLHGLGSVAFSKAGNYQVMASIYDSATHQLVAHTNTVTIQVTSDTLYPAYAIHPDDVLWIRLNYYISYVNAGPQMAGMANFCSTTRAYSDADMKFDFTQSVNGNTYSFVFSDSVRLASFPFGGRYGDTSEVQQVVYLPNFTSGTINLNVTWLNKLYTGIVTISQQGVQHISWDNSGAVKLVN